MRALALLIVTMFAMPPLAAEAWAAKIGLSLPLSGRYAPIGKKIDFGVLQAIEDHARQGGERPELVIVDDACTAEDFGPKAEALADPQIRIVIGLPCFGPAFALAETLDVPIIAAGLRHPETATRGTEAGKLWVLGPDGDAEARAIADGVLARWRDRPFALLDDGSVYGRSLSDRLRSLARERGLKPIESATFRPLQSNQAALVRRLARSGVEAIFVAGDAEDAATFARNAARMAPDMAVATGETGALVPFLDTPPPGGLLVVARPARRNEPKASILVERFENLAVPPDDGILEGYALAQIALDVLAGQPVAGRTHRTVVGDVTFGGDRRAVTAPFRVFRWNGARLEDIAAESDSASPAE